MTSTDKAFSGKRCIIFSAGSFFGLNDTIHRVSSDDYIIAADAGYRNCIAAGLQPDLLIGDFDSMDRPENFKNLEYYPVEKDETDTLLAVQAGIEHGCNEFHLYAATGGSRLDHSIANLQLLNRLARDGYTAYLYDSNAIYTAIANGTIEIKKTVSWGIVSVFCLAAPAKGVTIEGAQYNIENAELSPFFPIGVSNHFSEADSVKIAVADGVLTVCWEISQAE